MLKMCAQIVDGGLCIELSASPKYTTRILRDHVREFNLCNVLHARKVTPETHGLGQAGNED